jgi:hypothetical protein
MSVAAICPAVIRLCAIRLTALDAVGNPVAGPNNVYVSSNSIMLSVKPNVEAGEDKTLVGGCDCIIATYRGKDKLKWFEFELDQGVLEPGLQEMMLGSSVITDGDSNPIGNWWPEQLGCDVAGQPNVCLEAWQDLWEDDHQFATPYQFLHYIWPSTSWEIGDFELQNDFMQPKLTGYSRSNPAWGEGIFHDAPETVQPIGGYWFDNQIPDAACGWQTHSIT